MSNGGAPGIITPGGGGQTIIRKEGLQEELTLPLQQWRMLMLVRLLLAVSVLLLVTVWSPWSLILALPILIGWGIWIGSGYISQERLNNLSPATRYGLPVIALGLLVAWFGYYGQLAVEALWPATFMIGPFSIPLRFSWHWRILPRLLLSIPETIYLWCYRHIVDRLTYEIADPNWPPPVKERLPDTGPALRGSELRSEHPKDDKAEKEHAMREALRTIRVEIAHQDQNGRRWLEYVHLPVEDEQMVRVAGLVLAGRPFSELELSGGDNPLSGRDQYNALRDELLQRGVIHWKKPGALRQGLELTSFGRVVFQRLAQGDNGHSPTPQVDGVVRE